MILCKQCMSPFSKSVAVLFSLWSLYQCYCDLESEAHFNCPPCLLPCIFQSTVNPCFTKGLVASPSSFPTWIPSVLSNTIGEKKLEYVHPSFYTQYHYQRKIGKDLTIVYKKLTSSLATKFYYCIMSTQCEINMISYAVERFILVVLVEVPSCLQLFYSYVST